MKDDKIPRVKLTNIQLSKLNSAGRKSWCFAM